ncbi:luciferase family protein [Candidatus Nephthysia bennettiae]
MRGASELIREAVMSWPGVEAVPHRFGGIEYRLGRKEMGHVHGDRLADLPLPRKLHDEVIAAGRAQPHHVLPATGCVSCWMSGPEAAAGVIDLFRIQYQRYSAAQSRLSEKV